MYNSIHYHLFLFLFFTFIRSIIIFYVHQINMYICITNTFISFIDHKTEQRSNMIQLQDTTEKDVSEVGILNKNYYHYYCCRCRRRCHCHYYYYDHHQIKYRYSTLPPAVFTSLNHRLSIVILFFYCKGYRKSKFTV